MDDVVGGIVVAPGDVNLLAKDPVVIALSLGAGFHGSEIRPGTGFRQVHGARPLSGIDLFEIDRLQRFVGMSRDRQSGTCAQKRLQRKCHIGAVPHLAGSGAKEFGQALPAFTLRRRDADPASGPQLLNGIAIAWRDSHRAVAAARRIRIADSPQRRDHVGCKFSGLVQQCRCQLVAQPQLGILRQATQHRSDIQHVVDQKLHVIRWGRIHRCFLALSLCFAIRSPRDRIFVKLAPYGKNMAEEL